MWAAIDNLTAWPCLRAPDPSSRSLDGDNRQLPSILFKLGSVPRRFSFFLSSPAPILDFLLHRSATIISPSSDVGRPINAPGLCRVPGLIRIGFRATKCPRVFRAGVGGRSPPAARGGGARGELEIEVAGEGLPAGGLGVGVDAGII